MQNRANIEMEMKIKANPDRNTVVSLTFNCLIPFFFSRFLIRIPGRRSPFIPWFVFRSLSRMMIVFFVFSVCRMIYCSERLFLLSFYYYFRFAFSFLAR